MLSSKKGFTLIELLIVLIIIGVLATLAIPQYTSYVEKARAAEALSMLSALKVGEETYKLDWGVYGTPLSSMGVDNVYTDSVSAASANQYWAYVISATGTDAYTITASRDTKNGGSAAGQTIILNFTTAGGTTWAGNHPGRPKT